MFRLLPWPAPIGGNKVMTEEVKMLAPAGCAPGINVNVNVNVNALSQALPPLLKRKRSDSSVTDAPAATKPRPEPSVVAPTLSAPIPTVVSASNPVAAPVAPSSSSSVTTAREPAPAPAASVRPDVNRLRETITAQLSLEVLLKHNELRLIDQEIAKCQVALEQLRRCAEIPYPGSAVSGVSADVSAGTGASVLLPGNGPAPMSPAPWGVAEGPYSRHYARWLLPDPRFDGGEVEMGSLAVRDGGFMVPEGRSTRGNPMDFSSLAGKTRPSRGTPQAKLQSLSSGYPVPKEKPGPMLIRRKSDQVLVKLVCLDCRRDNFSSTQGFINHCRIAHNRNFASHDAAAMASGEPVEVDDAGAIIGGSAPRSESTSSVQATGLVHSLNRSTQLPTPSKESVIPHRPTLVKLPTAVATPPATVQPKPKPRRQSEAVKATRNPSFLASPATPHLSALMRDRGLGLNMDKLVAEAKTPVDLSAFSDDDSDADESGLQSTGTSQVSSQQGIPVARQPMRTPHASLQRSEGRKGIDRGPHDLPDLTPSRPPYQQSFLDLSSLGSVPHHSLTAPSRESDSLEHSANLSPNALESNQAPSLVSDDEDDYEAAYDSDSPSSSEADEEEQEFRHIEVEDDERAGAPSAATAEPKPGPSLTNPGPQAAPTLSNPLKQSRSKKMSLAPTFGDRRRDDKQAHFMHPSNEEAQLKRSNGQKPPPSNQ